MGRCQPAARSEDRASQLAAPDVRLRPFADGSDYNNFAPRLGIAWQVSKRTVLRAGTGIFYNTTFMQEINDLRKFWPYLPQQEISPNTARRRISKSAIRVPASAARRRSAAGRRAPITARPYSQQWNFMIQHQLMNDITVDVGYIGSSNKKQIGYYGWNNAPTPMPGPVDPRRLLAASGFTGNMDGGSNMFNAEYNAFQAKVTKRFSHGLQVLGNYTWGSAWTISLRSLKASIRTS